MERSIFNKNYTILLKSTLLSRLKGLKLMLEKSISMIINLSTIIYPPLLYLYLHIDTLF